MNQPNQPVDDNLNDIDINKILEEDKPLSLDETDEIVDKLLTYSFDDIMKNGDGEAFFAKGFNNGIESKIMTLRDLMVAHFYMEKTPETVTKKTKDDIVTEIASDYPDENALLAALLKIDPTIKLPENFNLEDYRTRAIGIYNAMMSLRRVIAEKLAEKYSGDVMVFLKYSPETLESLLKQIEDQYEFLNVEYEKLINKTGLPNEQILIKAIDFLTKCGRTPTQIQFMKDQKNLGEITQLYLKIERAIHMAVAAKKQNFVATDPEKMRQGIVDFLISDTHL